jgi:hypothetical protein
MVGEEPIYSDQNVSVTKAIAKIGDTSYPINAVSSLRVEKEMTNSSTLGCGCLSLVLGGLFALAGLGSLTRPNGPLLFMLGVLGIGGGVAAFSTHKPVHKYKLILVTASGEVSALSTQDKEHVDDVRAAIELAIELRS